MPLLRMHAMGAPSAWPPAPSSSNRSAAAAAATARHQRLFVRLQSSLPPTGLQHLPSVQDEGSLVARFPDAFRALPLVAGAAGIAGVVANRVASGVSCHSSLWHPSTGIKCAVGNCGLHFYRFHLCCAAGSWHLSCVRLPSRSSCTPLTLLLPPCRLPLLSRLAPPSPEQTCLSS